MSGVLVLKDVEREARVFRDRVLIACLGMALLMLLVLARLVKLQLIEHDYYTTRSQGNRLKVVPVRPTRGLIYSRDGVLVADNRPSFSLEVVPERVPNLKRTIAELQEIIAISAEDIRLFDAALQPDRRFAGVSLRLNLSEEEVARLAVERYRFPGVDIAARLTRHYPLGADLAHVVGYVGRIDKADLARIDNSNYKATSHIGKNGLERTYESVLHGRVGHQEVEVNAEGRVLRVLKRTAPQPGQDLYLNIDVGLQRTAARALGEHSGAVVAMDPRDGAVLALVSMPAYDPNLFVNGISVAQYRELSESPLRPLFNRALQAVYPPGSTIKPFVGLAGLAYGLRRPSQRTACSGWYSLGRSKHRYRCWNRAGHGTVELVRALAESCDVYFYRLSNDLGIERLHEYLSGYGFGRASGIDLPGESPGLLPSPQWKRRARGAAWYPGETLIAGIGQGYVLVNPLQLARATAFLVNPGLTYPPRIVHHRQDRITRRTTPISGIGGVARRAPSPEHLARVIEGMVEVVHGARGTAKAVGKDAPYRFAGKTGTAQVASIKQGQRGDNSKRPEHLRDHALFIAFAPVEAPRIVLAVMVEHGGSGSGAAAPIARQVLDYVLAPRPERPPEAAHG
ncbi:MAG: penicillin-binding protein 2 [Gammaproteobacteria bacterium]